VVVGARGWHGTFFACRTLVSHKLPSSLALMTAFSGACTRTNPARRDANAYSRRARLRWHCWWVPRRLACAAPATSMHHNHVHKEATDHRGDAVVRVRASEGGRACHPVKCLLANGGAFTSAGWANTQRTWHRRHGHSRDTASGAKAYRRRCASRTRERHTPPSSSAFLGASSWGGACVLEVGQNS